MKTKFCFAGLLGVAAVALAVVANGNPPPETNNPVAAASEKTLYTCGMHPWIIQDHPGNCPICGMKLEPVHKIGGATTPSAPSATIAIDPATVQMMNIQTAEIARGPLRRIVRTVGTIDYNETAVADVTTRFRGWIEKLDADATGQLVHRGEPLFEVRAPDLYDAQVEFLKAVTNSFKKFNSVIAERQAAIRNLKNFDVSDAQISEIESNRTVLTTLTVPAPISGFVIEKNAVAGQMVDAGIRLYRIADLGVVWVFAQVYEPDLPYVQLGQEATVKLSSLPDREFRGRVTYIYPDVDEKTRTAKVRLEFENPGYFLKPGMFVSAQITSELEPSALLVPDSAILRSGEKNTVFVALPGGKFDPRTINLGLEAEQGMVEVVSGLQAGERVVTSGQFMLDSESQLREAIDKMKGVESLNREIFKSETNSTIQPFNNSTNSETTVYVCPMPEHVSITYDHPGNCPICGMTLVPVTPGELKRLQPGGKVLYYTCPMPEHSSVHSDKPGKCPLCGMTLIPVMAPPGEIQPSNNPSIQTPVRNSPPTNPQAAKQLYTCPMHPEVVSDQPGQCPKCGMNLVPIEK